MSPFYRPNIFSLTKLRHDGSFSFAQAIQDNYATEHRNTIREMK
jgi:hypothetical protein